MCSTDVGMITYEWVRYEFRVYNVGVLNDMSDASCRGFSEPYPNFNTLHQCRNVEKVIEWGKRNAVHILMDHVSRFGNEVDLPEAP